jgi:hypothetical protein
MFLDHECSENFHWELFSPYIHVTEVLFHNWSFEIFQLEFWSEDWKFFVNVFSSLELKAQVSFSDRSLSGVRL